MAMNPRLLRPTANDSPASIPGLALWLDAAAADALYQNSDGTVPATALGDPVGYWRDRSGNGRHATQSTAASRPVVGSQNGRKALTFDGSNDNLFVEDYAVESNLPGLTRFLVFEAAAASQIFVTTTTAAKNASAGGSSWWQRFGANWYGYCGNGIRYHGGTADTAAHVATNFFDGSLAATFGVRLQNSIDGVLLPVVGSLGTLVATTSGSSAKLAVGSNAGVNNFVDGRLCELLCYTRALTAAERRKVEVYLARRWGVTLAPQVGNAEAQDWISRVYANGGTVSTSTASAVSTFCDAIEAAGIRDRFYRLGIFAGSNLNAALVPLYRGPTFGGTTYGNATDTNEGGLFVTANYNETGASGGLTGNGSSKYLNTGLAPSALPSVATGHMAAYAPQTTPADATKAFMGCASGSSQYNLSYSLNTGTGLARLRTTWGGTSGHDANEPSGVFRGGLRLSSRTSATAFRTYHNSTQVSLLETSVTPVSHANNWFVFAFNSAGTPIQYSSDSMRAYSIGESMSAEQVASYYTAMQTFQAALTRNV
jgi:hypothetical protein